MKNHGPLSRLRVAVLGALLAGWAQGSLAGPPLEDGAYVAHGICFGEGGCYSHWRASEPIEILERLDPSSKVIAVVAPGEWVEPLEGQLRMAPLRGVVHTAKSTPPLAVGDEVYMLEPLGEGDYVLWHDGQIVPHEWFDGDPDDPITWDAPAEAPSGVIYGWWVRVRLSDGRAGWIKEPRFECMGPLQGSIDCRE